ncbi:type II toxin-antitoxin system RelE/ParE family toxin [Candidatus Pacearchaeota archaeon]|nr:type II toxin-antitoxin system RelE/ParE family toxin [Candidatus Pacearchaeota archaeon]
MVEIEFMKEFKIVFYNIKDNLLKKRVIKQIEKIRNNPKVGKPMRNVRKGIRELRIKPFRLSYIHFSDKDLIYILDLYHKKGQ